MTLHRRFATGVAALAAATLLLAACSKDSNSTDNPNTSGGDAGRKYAVVTHASAGDAFWDVVKKGAEQAGKDLDAAVSYQGSGKADEQADLINAAIGEKVQGLVVSMANPDALAEPIKKAVAAGIPVITINSGQAKSAEFGALTHVGQDETVAGQGAGEQLAGVGVKKLLCVIHEAGNIGLEQRCTGAKSGLAGGQVVNLQVDINDVAEAQNTIASKLQADSAIDGVLALNPAVGAGGGGRHRHGQSQAQVATFDLSADVIAAIADGKVLFAVDQQQYLQGYLPIVMLNLYATNANTVGGGQPVLTGPDSSPGERRQGQGPGRQGHPLSPAGRTPTTAPAPLPRRHPSGTPYRHRGTPAAPRHAPAATGRHAFSEVGHGIGHRRGQRRGPETRRTPGPNQRRAPPAGPARAGRRGRRARCLRLLRLLYRAVRHHARDANVLDPAATLGIMAVAVALLMIGGEFDLSAGVMTASSGLMIGMLVDPGRSQRLAGHRGGARGRCRGRVVQRRSGHPHRAAQLHRHARHVPHAAGRQPGRHQARHRDGAGTRHRQRARVRLSAYRLRLDRHGGRRRVPGHHRVVGGGHGAGDLGAAADPGRQLDLRRRRQRRRGAQRRRAPARDKDLAVRRRVVAATLVGAMQLLAVRPRRRPTPASARSSSPSSPRSSAAAC